MKRLLMLIPILFIVCEINAQSFSGDSWAKAQSSKKANIVVTYTDAPKFAEKVNGKYSGVCFDIMNDFVAFVKEKYGITVNVTYKDLARTQDFDLFLNTVKASNGGVFGLGDVTITDERKSIYTFSPSYFSNVAILATNQSAPRLSSLSNISKDFNGMIAVVQNETTHEQRMRDLKAKYFPALKIETTVTFDEANKKVASNPKYFTYIDFSTYMQVLEQKLNIQRQPAGDQKGENFGFIMPKNSDWDKPMQEFFSQNGGYTNSTEYRKILASNLGNYILRLLDAMNE
ncbi:substrate-binding periplasmic protein [Fulvivirga aurantia]|uniref:substrate-binding periplasmic protein n=1 Tax=Fulvivirga aurantia TaxID=2529383 RepID=UPI00162758E0|nr:transporter substrate-binding domain-containing protein [Fulvivirga aurantia]